MHTLIWTGADVPMKRGRDSYLEDDMDKVQRVGEKRASETPRASERERER